MFKQDVINYFDIMMFKFFQSNNSLYSEKIAENIASILFDEDENSKKLFFDYFKNIQCDSKKQIVTTCLINVINKIHYVVENSNAKIINSTANYINNINRSLILNMQNFVLYGSNENLTQNEFEELCKLNNFEKSVISSMCLNIMSFSYDSICGHLYKIIYNKQDFVENFSKYKTSFIQLLKFYIPIYNFMSRINNINYPIEYEFVKDYIKIYPLTEILKTKFIYPNFDVEICRDIPEKAYIYYMIYQFLINIKSIPNANLYMNKIFLMLDHNNLKLDNEMLSELLVCCKFGINNFELEDQIDEIKNLKKQNVNDIINLYASFDIAQYNQLENKKKVFGLN